MNSLNINIHSKSSAGRLQDRRMVNDRRLSAGRRSMIRFDNMGGDRRSGYARRRTDMGFREPAEEI